MTPPKPKPEPSEEEIDIIPDEEGLNLTMDGNNVDGDDFQKNPVPNRESEKKSDYLEKEHQNRKDS